MTLISEQTSVEWLGLDIIWVNFIERKDEQDYSAIIAAGT
jgi:hypothetical protein